MSRKALILFAVLFIMFFCSTVEAEIKLSFPSTTWDTWASPEDARISTSALNTFISVLYDDPDPNKNVVPENRRFFISRFGKKVDGIHGSLLPPGTNDISSADKVFLTHFLLRKVGIGVDDLTDKITNIPSINNKIENFINNSANPYDVRVTKNRDIQWDHFANQTSNYGVTENPGERFAYNNYQTALFWHFLVDDLYGSNADDVMQNSLFDYIGFDNEPRNVPNEPSVKYFNCEQYGTEYPEGVRISPRDFSRFGLLYLNRGKWNDTQIVREDLAIMATSSSQVVNLPRSYYHESLLELETIFPTWGVSDYKDPNLLATEIKGSPIYEEYPDKNFLDALIDNVNIPVIDLDRSTGAGHKLTARDKDNHGGSYGWMWWKYGAGSSFWTNISPENDKYAKGFFAAIGKNCRDVMLVFPRLNLIVTWFGAKEKDETFQLPIDDLLDGIDHSKQNQIVKEPNHGEALNLMSHFDIVWDGFEFGIFEDLDIFLYDQSGTHLLGRIARVKANAEKFDWIVGKYYAKNGEDYTEEEFVSPNATGYKIEISTTDSDYSDARDITDLSDVTFSIGDQLPTYTITPTANPNGTIDPSGPVVITQGENQTFQITPNSGYVVQSVTVDGINQGEVTSYTFNNVQANHSITATFALIGITIESPNDGGSLEFNTFQNITWDAPGITGRVQISLYRNDVKIGWIANPLASADSYSWKVGTDDENTAMPVPAGNGYKVLIKSWDGVYSDMSNAPFNVTRSSGSLTVSSPNGGENWQKFSTHPITWTAPGVTGNVQISLYRNGTKIGWIANRPASSGTYSWIVGVDDEDNDMPVPVGSGYIVQIKSMDGKFIDESDGPFSISSN